MQVCQEALELNGRLISTDQLLYHDDLKTKFQEMEEKLAPFQDSEMVRLCLGVYKVAFRACTEAQGTFQDINSPFKKCIHLGHISESGLKH